MKRTHLISAVILLLLITACGGGNKQSTHGIVTVDVNTKYPQKELIIQDFMDIEYIPLETTDEFITQGVVQAVGKKLLLVKNRTHDGDIFVFDRGTGKGLRKINRMGQGPEEYSQSYEMILDEDRDELFIFDYSARTINVYDLHGNFKRSFKVVDEESYYLHSFNYDQDHLLCYKAYSPGMETERSSHILIDKQDGSIVREIQLPFSEIRTPVITEGDATIMPGFYPAIPTHTGWGIMRTSSDTIYNYSSNGDLNPIIVRTPTITSMNPEIFLFPTVISDRYYFMQTLKKEFDMTTFKGFFRTNLVYDKQENALFEYSVYNDDFISKQQVSFGKGSWANINQEIAAYVTLDAADLVEAANKGELKGALKAIAQQLDEEANAVIMLVKHKK